ncbi:MAG TPA: hypothetical protein VHM29_12315 [Acidimicrobiia bacterium]|nr:hypothetical protein [Acidimicrobiia bacterium]
MVGNAGTVVVGRRGDTLQIISATPNAGWASEVEVASGREVEGDFRNGALRAKYNFELEDGTVRVRIEAVNNNDGDDDNSRGDDDDDSLVDDDNSGSRHDGDDDDSGSGSGGDDHDDDNSGSGSGDDDHDDDD